MTRQTTDAVVQAEMGGRMARLRLERNLTQEQLANAAGVSKRTVERLEAGAGAQLSGFIRVCRALNLLERLAALVPEPAPGPIARLKLQGKQRRRASGAKPVPAPGKPWQWGEAA